MGLDPKVWGHHAWFLIYSIAFVYPEKPNEFEIKNAREFYTSLSKSLPCTDCRKHFIEHLMIYPLTDEVLSSHRNLLDWVIHLNNTVNAATGSNKVETYDSIVKQYKKEYDTSTFKDKHGDIIWHVVLPLAILLILLINKKYIVKGFN